MKNEIAFESLSPNLIVDDVNKTVEFYTTILGFDLIASVPESGIFNWAMVMKETVTLMFQSLASIQDDLPELKIEKKANMGTLFIKMNGVDVLYEKIKNQATIISPMRTTFYGMKEFTIEDLNGYFLTFAEDVK